MVDRRYVILKSINHESQELDCDILYGDDINIPTGSVGRESL